MNTLIGKNQKKVSYSKSGMLSVLHGVTGTNNVVGSVGTFERYDLNRGKMRNKLFTKFPAAKSYILRQYEIVML